MNEIHFLKRIHKIDRVIKYTLCTVLIASFAIIMTESLFAMENQSNVEAELQAHHVLKKTSLPESVPAEKLLNFAKEWLASDPNLTMVTKLSSKEGVSTPSSLYERHKSFITENIKDRDNKNRNIIEKRMEKLDELITQQGWKKEMSCADLTFISYAWVRILTDVTLNEENYLSRTLPRTLQDYQNTLQFYLSTLINNTTHMPEPKDIKPFHFITSRGLVLPFVSHTGIVPIPIINEGCGFFISGSEKVSSVDFLAVGTNKSLSFDFVTEVNATDAWDHDLAHAESGKRVKYKLTDVIDPLKYAYKIATFRSYVLQKLKDDPERQKLFELAFFSVFHEKEPTTVFDNMSNVAEDFIRYVNQIKEKNYLFYKHHILNLHRENAQTQYETEIAGARSLKIDIKEGSYEEQLSDYLGKLIGGLDILKEYAHVYNEATYSK